MKNEIPEYVSHTDCEICGFFGEKYRFLSNFYKTPVWYEGVLYPSSENAYQAAKVDCDDRKDFLTCTPNESKKLWKSFHSIYTEESWDIAKFDIMSSVVFDKFVRSLGLRRKLIETGDRYLEETNHWSDSTWGVNYKTKIGKNWLGIILMNTREFWKNKPMR